MRFSARNLRWILALAVGVGAVAWGLVAWWPGEQTASAAEELSSQSMQLNKIVSRFNLSHGESSSGFESVSPQEPMQLT